MSVDVSPLDPVYLNYYVVFSAEAPSEPYAPFIPVPFSKSLGEGGRMHGFDPALEGILPAIWYCLHLPRHGFDTMDISPPVIASGHSVPHSILPVPSYVLPELSRHTLVERHPPTLVISEDSCFEAANAFALQCGAPLGSVPISALSSDLLTKHWTGITQCMQKLPIVDAPLAVNPKLLSDHARAALPMMFLANQLGMSQYVLEELESHHFAKRARLQMAVHMRSLLNAMVELEQDGVVKPSEDQFSQAVDRHLGSTRVPMVITLPGTPASLRPDVPAAQRNVLGPTERTVVDLLGVHRAAARTGVWLNGGTLPTTLFQELRRLEAHCRASREKNRYVWNSMKRIGKYVAEQLGPDGPTAIQHASQITAYTDFPIGLAILPGIEDPLCCIKPISYRPLTPLTRALQIDLRRTGEVYIGRGFKVIIAECLPSNDSIRRMSDAGWQVTREMLKSHRDVEVVYAEVQSIKALKDLLLEHGDAAILVISAHGLYAQDRNIAGLCIGEDVWLAGEDDIHVPPVVVLSACHVAPRGGGAVTVNDMLLRAGAVAVLGTLIPVDVRRNALLTVRLFTYISEALAGRGQFRSLDEAWRWVVASNAVNEVVASSERLMAWAHKRPAGKRSPIEEFMLERSNGRLRPGHIYADTVTLLRELATESGFKPYFNAILSSQGFFPESCFYVLSGAPENVLLTEPVFEQADNRGTLPNPP